MKVQFKSAISRNQITIHQYISEVSSMRSVCACSKGRTCWHAASRIWFNDSSIEVPWLYVSLRESQRVWVRSWKCEKKNCKFKFQLMSWPLSHLAISCRLQWLYCRASACDVGMFSVSCDTVAGSFHVVKNEVLFWFLGTCFHNFNVDMLQYTILKFGVGCGSS